MKLRSRTRTTTDDSSTVLPLDITRLQTPPISERRNAASTVARKDRPSQLSSTIMDLSDTEETINSVSPIKKRRSPTATVPAAPLTKTNLAKHQEEMTPAVEIASEDESSPPPTPNTRLTQARNYLLTEDVDTDPDFHSHYLHIVKLVDSHRHGEGHKEVLQLLKQHSHHVMIGPKQRRPRSSPTTGREASRTAVSLAAEDDPDPEEQADPFEWTNKLDDLTQRVKKSPSVGREDFAVSSLRELARPLNGGRLPSAAGAYNLINEQMMRENHETRTPSEIDHDQLWAFEKNLPPASKEKFSFDRWSGHQPEASRTTTLQLGEGSLMPQEMMDFDWDRDHSRLVGNLLDYEDIDGGEAQLLLAETPFLQALMSDQIESDLAASTFDHARLGRRCFFKVGRKDANRL